jgi:hypothetical protein
MARIHGERCYRLATVRSSWGSDLRVCGREVPSKVTWRRVVGSSGDGRGASVELELTSPRVRSLRLLLGHPRGADEPTWERFNTRVLNAAQAEISHMPRDFRFAVVVEPHDFCVEAVEAFDRRGVLIEDEAVPCEY